MQCGRKAQRACFGVRIEYRRSCLHFNSWGVMCLVMEIAKLQLTDFMPHVSATLELPPKGLVLVSGSNGVGKSSATVEAASWGLFGKSVRSPAPDTVIRVGAAKASVRVVTRSGFWLERSRTSKGAAVTFDGATGNPTTSKAQASLEAKLGTNPDTWRRGHVVTSGDVASFSLATDAARKSILEDACGLRAFDLAHSAARTDRQTYEKALAIAQHTHEAAANTQRQLEAVLGSLQDAMPPQPHTSLNDALGEQAKASSELGRLQREVQSYHSAVAVAEQRVADLAGTHCRVCKQPLPHRDEYEHHVGELLAARDEYEAALARTSDLVRAAREAMERAMDDVAKARAFEHSRAAWEQNQRAVQKARDELARNNEALAAARERVTHTQREFDLVSAAERVLSPKGFRSFALSSAVAAIEELSNHYLSWLHPDIRVALPSQVSRGADVVGLRVEGVAGSSYGSASDGQRRRVDLALALAVAAVAAQGSPGTLFLDECFDHLDASGVGAAVRLLHHLAADRPVVLITHNTELADHVPVDQRISF